MKIFKSLFSDNVKKFHINLKYNKKLLYISEFKSSLNDKSS